MIQGNGRDNVDLDEAGPLEGNTWDLPTHLSLEEARKNEQKKREAWSEDERRFDLTRKHRRCSTFSGAIYEAPSARVTPQGSGYGEAGGTTDSGARLSRGRGRSLTAPPADMSDHLPKSQLPVDTDRVSSTRLSSSDSSRFPPGAHSTPRTAFPLALVGTSRDHVGYGGPSTAQGEEVARRETLDPTLQRVPSQSVPDLPLRSSSEIVSHGGQGRTRASSVSGEEPPKQYLPGHRRGGSYDINKSLPNPPPICADPKLWPFSTLPDELLPCLAVPIPKPLLLGQLSNHPPAQTNSAGYRRGRAARSMTVSGSHPSEALVHRPESRRQASTPPFPSRPELQVERLPAPPSVVLSSPETAQTSYDYSGGAGGDQSYTSSGLSNSPEDDENSGLMASLCLMVHDGGSEYNARDSDNSTLLNPEDWADSFYINTSGRAPSFDDDQEPTPTTAQSAQTLYNYIGETGDDAQSYTSSGSRYSLDYDGSDRFAANRSPMYSGGGSERSSTCPNTGSFAEFADFYYNDRMSSVNGDQVLTPTTANRAESPAQSSDYFASESGGDDIQTRTSTTAISEGNRSLIDSSIDLSSMLHALGALDDDDQTSTPTTAVRAGSPESLRHVADSSELPIHSTTAPDRRGTAFRGVPVSPVAPLNVRGQRLEAQHRASTPPPTPQTGPRHPELRVNTQTTGVRGPHRNRERER